MFLVDFLSQEFASIYEVALEAEKNIYTAPRTSIFYSRHTLERAVNWLYDNDDYLIKPEKDTLHELLLSKTFQENLNRGMGYTLDYIRRIGNRAVHSEELFRSNKSLEVFKYLHSFLGWIHRYYSELPQNDYPFNEEVLKSHHVGGIVEKNEAELLQLSKQLEDRGKELSLLQKENNALKERLQYQNPRTRVKNNITSYTEEETRTLIIDEMLLESGWSVDRANLTHEHPVDGQPTPTGKGFVDYVAWDDSKVPIAIVEAKRTSISPKDGHIQALNYARSIEKHYGIFPVIFLTNGFDVFISEKEEEYPRRVNGFYRLDELSRSIHRRENKKPLKDIVLRKEIAGRYYQEEAIRRVTETFEKGNRHALVVMATGTGKTRTVASLIDVLTRAEWVKKILFLADRKELVSQASGTFTEFLPHQPSVNMLRDRYDTSANFYFSTYGTMMNALDQRKSNGEKQFSVGAFDLIVIDEAHRSVYQKYGSVFQYFDSLLVGLTATPKSDLDKNTFSVFQLEDGIPTFAYEYEKAVEEKFLVPAIPISVETTFLREGIQYELLSEEEKEKYEDTFTDSVTGEMPTSIEPSHLNEWLFNSDTMDSVWKVLMEHGIKINSGDEIGKTIIFAKNKEHARFMVDRFYALFGSQYHSEFVQVIDYHVRNPEHIIKNFKRSDRFPRIAVSVDMLDTGIDVPEIVNLVLVKPVYSKAKFWQMIGRGTRLCENLFGPGLNKKEFYVFDFCKNIEFFEAFPEGKEAKAVIPLSTKLNEVKARLIFQLSQEEHKEDDNNLSLRNSLVNEFLHNIKSLDKTHFLIKPYRAYVEKYENPVFWESLLEDELREIIDYIAPLITVDDLDSKKRFDLLLLTGLLGILKGEEVSQSLVKRLTVIGRELEKKRNLEEVQNEIKLIREIQKPIFFEHCTVEKLLHVHGKLRDLIKYMDKNEVKPLYTDFVDKVESITVRELPRQSDYHDYRTEIRSYLKGSLAQSLALQKIRNNREITLSDLEQLESILFQEREEAREEFYSHFGAEKGLTVLVRQLLGLDLAAAKEAFSEFLEDKTLNSNQIDFINIIIDYFVQYGVLEPKKLFEEKPFTNKHSSGVIGLFPEKAKRMKLMRIVQSINKHSEIS
ncbi:DEAD/DEAH box helicase family protein [Gottfriedia acidiceleris]|uniref:DEAD/DEAH box helicase family protein n=1 Tax=Gottfriedia acidiceleris TaxID=371036 RepID=UPI00111BEC30|nr:DEAD/DEAH box helicase family protein [Gottfriedia acidiceleris]